MPVRRSGAHQQHRVARLDLPAHSPPGAQRGGRGPGQRHVLPTTPFALHLHERHAPVQVDIPPRPEPHLRVAQAAVRAEEQDDALLRSGRQQHRGAVVVRVRFAFLVPGRRIRRGADVRERRSVRRATPPQRAVQSAGRREARTLDGASFNPSRCRVNRYPSLPPGRSRLTPIRVQLMRSRRQGLPERVNLLRAVADLNGKRLRGTSAHEVQGIHMVNVWAARQGLCLSAQAVKGKQNELSTLPSVLDTLAYLDVAGCIVTIDAMGTQRTLARKLVALQAQYVLALKGNQDTLFEDVQEMFDDAARRLFADTALLGVSTWDGRRREERRTCWVLPASPDLDDHEWPGLQSVALIESSRLVKGKRVSQRRLFLCSFAPDPLTALHAVRTHWQVENSLH